MWEQGRKVKLSSATSFVRKIVVYHFNLLHLRINHLILGSILRRQHSDLIQKMGPHDEHIDQLVNSMYIYIYSMNFFFLGRKGKGGDWLCREIYFPFVVEQQQYYIYENDHRELKCQKLMLNLVGVSMFIDLSYLFLLEPYNWDPNHGNFSSWRSRKARS